MKDITLVVSLPFIQHMFSFSTDVHIEFGKREAPRRTGVGCLSQRNKIPVVVQMHSYLWHMRQNSRLKMILWGRKT